MVEQPEAEGQARGETGGETVAEGALGRVPDFERCLSAAAGRDDDADRPHRRFAVRCLRRRDQDLFGLDIRRREEQGVDAVDLPQEKPLPESDATELQAHLRACGQPRNRQVVFHRRRCVHRRLHVQDGDAGRRGLFASCR